MTAPTAEERATAAVTEWFRIQWPSSSLDPHVDCDYKKLTKCIAAALHAHAGIARAEEREACARIAETTLRPDRRDLSDHCEYRPGSDAIAAAIRARA